MATIVSKFGGSSLADAEQIKKVLKIVKSDKNRRYVVVSAPGRRNPRDQKITDLLYEWQHLTSMRLSSGEIQRIIATRFQDIVRELGLSIDIESELERVRHAIEKGASPDFAASRGEYLNAKIVAAALRYDFVDASSCILFGTDGKVSDYSKLRKVLKGRRAVIPGFYGSKLDGSIKTFSRGGSDITGAIVACAVKAKKYENWTDVSGLLMADPNIVKNPRRISFVTYRELRELAYMGARVFHEEAMFPVQEAKIPTHIRNTNAPKEKGTMVMPDNGTSRRGIVISGIAGKRGFSVITMDKTLMSNEVGFIRKVMSVFESNHISIEHVPSGIDSISVILEEKHLAGKIERLVRQIKSESSPENIEVFPRLALIAVVGRGMAHTKGVAAKIFTALAKAGINIRVIDQGSSEINIIIGVEDKDYENAIRAIYRAFVK